jgi:carbamoyl-phosphate synthase large subunit
VDKVAFLESARLMDAMGIKFFATAGTAEFLTSYGFDVTVVYWPSEGKHPDAGELIEQKQVDLVINIPKNFQETELTNDYVIRRKAVISHPLLTNIQLANRPLEALFERLQRPPDQGTAGLMMMSTATTPAAPASRLRNASDWRSCP